MLNAKFALENAYQIVFNIVPALGRRHTGVVSPFRAETPNIPPPSLHMLNNEDFSAMKQFNQFIMLPLSALLILSLWGCAPEIGSEKWCANLKAKPKGDWSLNETGDYAKHCILR